MAFLYTLVIIGAGIALCRFSVNRMKPILAAMFFSLALAAWIYAYLLPGDYGVLDVVVLTNPGRFMGFKDGLLARDIILAASEAFGLLILLIAVSLGTFKIPKKILPVLVVLNTDGLNRAGDFTKGTAYLPKDSTQTFRFSDEKNIVVLMVDMFGVDHFPRILNEYSEIRTSLDGFVWYPSTPSVGYATYGSLPAMGRLACSPYSRRYADRGNIPVEFHSTRERFRCRRSDAKG